MDRYELLQIIRYYAPYLSSVERELLAEKDAYEIAWNQEKLLSQEKLWEQEKLLMPSACDSAEIHEELEENERYDSTLDMPFFSRISKNMHCQFENVKASPSTEEQELHDLLEEFNETVRRMKEKGVEVEFLHELLEKGDIISRMYITENLSIILPDYEDMEIEMPALPKTVYLFFLLHPEGIRLKELEDYKTELYNIYRQVKPWGGETKAHVTITNLINPVNNNMNEKLSQIKTFINRAITARMDQRLAKHYYIEGEKGGIYRLALDRNLIEFED